MKNLRCVTKPYKIPSMDVPGIYSVHTENGKTFFCYSQSHEDAQNNIMNGLNWRDRIVSIGREHNEF